IAEVVRERDAPDARTRLRRAVLIVAAPLPLDRQRGLALVEVGPLPTEQLALARSEPGRELQGERVVVSSLRLLRQPGSRLEQQLDLVIRRDENRPLLLSGRPIIGGELIERVARDQPPPYGQVENHVRRQHVALDRAPSERALVPLLVDRV